MHICFYPWLMEGTHNIPLLENKLKICIQHNSLWLQQRSPFTIHIQGDDRDHGADILVCWNIGIGIDLDN